MSTTIVRPDERARNGQLFFASHFWHVTGNGFLRLALGCITLTV
jgi:hypothetical protein